MCVCLPYVRFIFPSRYTTSSIGLHTYVHGRTIKRASTAPSGNHSAQQNELFLSKSVSASRCGRTLNGTSVDVRMQTYKEVVYLEGKRIGSSSSFLPGTLLLQYVYISTSTDVPLSELPQRLTDKLFHRKSSFCCAEWCPLSLLKLAYWYVRGRTYVDL